MKLITLNTWGGRIHKPLLSFFHKNKDVDIFCLQEIYKEANNKEKEYLEDALDLYNDIQGILIDHTGYFRPSVGDHYGLAIFVKKNINVIEEGDINIYQVSNYNGGGNHSRNLQYIKIQEKDNVMLIANVHGLWNGQGKSDTEERLQQSKNIQNFIKSFKGDVVLCGDFNLLPETESINILEKIELKNLIKEYNIKSTRTALYTKPLQFADYVFVSNKRKVTDFKVCPDEVSDHAPLFLEI